MTAEALGAVMIGVNCVGDKALLLDVLARMRAVSVLPVIVQPNAGVPEKREGVSRYTVSPGDMAETMQEAVQMGASGIGGCCGTTPEHIRRMAVLSAQAEQPKPVNDGKKRICSLTKWTTFLEAADSAEEWTPGSAGNPDAAAIWLDMRGMRPNNAAAWVMRVQQHTAAPLLFRVNNPEVLAAATRVYAGVACADGA